MLLIGPPGSGKSDLLLRLMQHGFSVVADDQVIIEDGLARAPATLAGLLEIRGLGIVRVAHAAMVRLALVVELAGPVDRLPEPARHTALDLPMMRLDPWRASAPSIVAMALDCALGRVSQLAGAFVSISPMEDSKA